MHPEWDVNCQTFRWDIWKCINITPTIMPYTQPVCLSIYVCWYAQKIIPLKCMYSTEWLRVCVRESMHLFLRVCIFLRTHITLSICSYSHLSLTLFPSPHHSTSQGIAVGAGALWVRQASLCCWHPQENTSTSWFPRWQQCAHLSPSAVTTHKLLKSSFICETCKSVIKRFENPLS